MSSTATVEPTTAAAPAKVKAKAAGVLATLIMVLGGILGVAGAGTWAAVQFNLSQEQITVSDDSPMFAGQPVDGPLTAYAEAEIIEAHYLETTGGKTYAELDREDPVREVAMNASFLRASLFTSVVAFGVSLLSMGLGAVLVLIGAALRSLTTAVRSA